MLMFIGLVFFDYSIEFLSFVVLTLKIYFCSVSDSENIFSSILIFYKKIYLFVLVQFLTVLYLLLNLYI